jgi:hypothetical protein
MILTVKEVKLLYYAGEEKEFRYIRGSIDELTEEEYQKFLNKFEFIQDQNDWDGSEDRTVGFVWKHKDTGKFILANNYYSSWSSYDDINVYLVEPKQITKYFSENTAEKIKIIDDVE